MNHLSPEKALGEPYELSYLELDPDSHYHKLLQRCPDIQPIRFRDQQYIIRQGNCSNEIYIVLRGSCLIEDEKGGHGVANSAMALIHGDEQAPAFVGEMSHLADGVRIASVKSAGATHTLCLQPRHMEIIVNEFPLFTQVLCRQFTARLRESNAALRKIGESLEMQAESTFCTDGHVLYREEMTPTHCTNSSTEDSSRQVLMAGASSLQSPIQTVF